MNTGSMQTPWQVVNTVTVRAGVVLAVGGVSTLHSWEPSAVVSHALGPVLANINIVRSKIAGGGTTKDDPVCFENYS